MKPVIDYTLYLCTDRGLMSTDTIEESVELAIKGGCTLVQLREKDCSSREFYETAVKVKVITDKYQVPLIINDRLDIALAVQAAGVHIGQSDLPAKTVRRIVGEDMIIGVSASTAELCQKAQEDGADYVGVGAMFATATKDTDIRVTMEELAQIRKAVSIPIVAIGGINQNNAANFKDTGIQGLAVVSAVVAQPDIEKAARELKQAFVL